jgi:hypothetical protein
MPMIPSHRSTLAPWSAAVLAAVLFGACQHGQSAPRMPDALRGELLRMEAEDQALDERMSLAEAETQEIHAEMRALSVRHARRMQEIVRRHGWPTRSMVGDEAARAAWLLVQHADHDPAFQRRVLALMEPLVEAGEVRVSHYAYLWDRTHDPQRYGTQGGCVAQGVWKPRRIEMPDEVDVRRAAAGMIPAALADYVRMMSMRCEHWRGEAPPN